MVFDSIISPKEVENRPIEMLIFGFIISSVSIVLALWVFPSYASFAMVTFTVMATLPLIVNIIRIEKEKQSNLSFKFLTHKSVISAFIFLFLGFLIAFTSWFLFLPVDMANHLFFIQINTLTEMNAPSGAIVSGISGTSILGNGLFSKILFNNLRVLALSIIFSFIFASGAIFILAWNASVLAVGMGNNIKLSIASGGSGSVAYFGAISFASLRYLIHGIPEITSYLIGGLAGGMISFGILDYKFGFKKLSKNLPKVLKDSSFLIIFSVVLLVIAALIEIYITSIF